MYVLNTLLLLIVSAVLYVYWYFKKAHKFFDQYDIPYPKPHWFYGNMRDIVLMKKPIWTAYGDIYDNHLSDRFVGLYTLHRPAVMVIEPELIKNVLVKDFSHFHDRGFPVNKEAEPMSMNLFNLAGDEWRNLRIKLTSTFTSGKMKMMFPLLKETAAGIKPALMKYYQDNQAFDAKELCARYTTDVIGSCAFGVDTQCLKNPESEFRQVGRSIFKPRWQLLFRMFFPKMPTSFIKFFKLHFFPESTCNYFGKLVTDMVKYREENNVTRGDFLDLLIAMKNHKELEKLKDQHDEGDLDKFMTQIGKKSIKSDVEMSVELMAAQCFLFFVGGFEGASNTLMFVLLALAENPHIQDKLRKEIKSALDANGGELTYEMMKNIPYLEMVIDETLRKFPSSGLLFRTCTETYKIPDSDAIIKKGTQVVIPTLAIHSDKRYFEKADEFYPEHFSEEAKLKRHHFTFLPFGEGPRVCIAERFGRMQVIVGLIYMLKDFSFELSPKTKLPLEYAATGSIAVIGGIWLKCRPL